MGAMSHGFLRETGVYENTPVQHVSLVVLLPGLQADGRTAPSKTGAEGDHQNDVALLGLA